MCCEACGNGEGPRSLASFAYRAERMSRSERSVCV